MVEGMDSNTKRSVEMFNTLHISSLDDDGDVEDEQEMPAEEDDGEDDDEQEPVTLGFLEKPKNSWSVLRQLFPSKAGGVPAWLDPINLPSGRSCVCDICGDPLQFLLQVYAPISEKESAFHRTLFVFMCPSMSCLLRDQHEQWKRRPEKPSRSVKVFRCQLPRCNPFYSSEPPRHDGDDKPSKPGVALCKWCGTWKGDKVCSSCKKEHYCSQKHQVMHWRSSHKIDCQQLRFLPGYLTLTQVIMKPHQGRLSNGDIDKKCWVSFQSRIAKAPEQVLRYCRNGSAKPIWPMSSGQPSKADIPNCCYCGGPSNFEFQILPETLYYFGVKNDVDSLDWATIVVYTCGSSCEASVNYKEEFAWVQLYS